MRTTKSTLSVFFAISLAILFLFASSSIGEISGTDNNRFFGMAYIFWYALGGFALGLVAGILILRHLSRRTLGLASIALGILAFIALALLFFFFREKSASEVQAKPTAWVETSKKEGLDLEYLNHV